MRDVSARVIAYSATNLTAALALFAGGCASLYFALSPAWYAWFLIAPVLLLVCLFFVERVASYATNSIVAAIYRRHDARQVIAGIQRRIRQFGDDCRDPTVPAQIRAELDSCEDPIGVSLILLRSRKARSWSGWVMRALPVYIGLGRRSDGRERVVLWKHMKLAIPGHDQDEIGYLCHGEYVDVTLSPEESTIVQSLVPIVGRERLRSRAQSEKAKEAIVTHALEERGLYARRDNPQLASRIEQQHKKALFDSQILPAIVPAI